MVDEDEKRILLTDGYEETAFKIYNNFVVNQNCTIRGMCLVDGDPIPKGEMVIRKLDEYDKRDNIGSGNRRKRVKPENSIGDYIAQKMFTWEMRIQDKKPVYMIWRRQ